MTELSKSRPTCDICKKSCRKNQSIVKCKLCNKYFHRKCENVSLVDYRMMKASRELFSCKKCTDESIPFQSIDNFSDPLFSNSKPKFDSDACLDPEYLNNLFICNPDDDIDTEKFHEIDCCFKPIPAKYYSASNISFDELVTETDSIEPISNKFSSIGINMRSLANAKNFAKLQLFMKSLCFKPSVIAINETFLRDNEPGPHCSLEGYHFISNCRNSHKGGGVGIYVLDSLNYKIAMI